MLTTTPHPNAPNTTAWTRPLNTRPQPPPPRKSRAPKPNPWTAPLPTVTVQTKVTP